MTTEKMTIHKALAEIKNTYSRFAKTESELVYVTSVKHTAKTVNGVDREIYKESTKSAYDKLNSLINRRSAIKRAIILSNACTKVTVCGKEYTVAEAIEMKDNVMPYYKRMLEHMSFDLTKARNTMESYSGDAIEKKAEQYIVNIISAQPKESKMGADSDAIKALKKQYIEDNMYDMVNPLLVEAEIEKLRDFIDGFMTEVDSALSVSNALTTIEVSY